MEALQTSDEKNFQWGSPHPIFLSRSIRYSPLQSFQKTFLDLLQKLCYSFQSFMKYNTKNRAAFIFTALYFFYPFARLICFFLQDYFVSKMMFLREIMKRCGDEGLPAFWNFFFTVPKLVSKYLARANFASNQLKTYHITQLCCPNSQHFEWDWLC